MTASITNLQLFKARRDREQLVEPIVEHWPCRVGICIAKVGVTATALWTLDMFNAELRRRREKPIAKEEVMVCAQHTDKLVKSRW